jgi:septal ring factor EnvC (AmiA/AmiB activator)
MPDPSPRAQKSSARQFHEQLMKAALGSSAPSASDRRRAYTSLFIAILLGTACLATGQPPAERAQTEALARRAAERLAALQRESEALARQERTLLIELRKLEIDREIRIEQLARIARDVADVQGKLAAATTRSQALQGEADRQRPDIEGRLVQLYKMGRAGYWRLLLDVNSLRDVGRAYRTASALGRIDRDRVEEHRRTLGSLRAERAALEARSKELRTLQQKARDASAAVDRAVAARTHLVETIDSRRDLNAQLTGELQDAQQKLQATLSQVAAGHAPGAVSLPLRPFQGALPWPAEGVLSARFGKRRPGTAGPAVRTGIELSLPEGQPVHPIHEGTVAFADPFSGYGNLVIVDHGDKAYSLYGHLSSVSVKKGDRVDTSSTVGLAGRNPAGNPALYFELRVDGKPVDPVQWLKR